MSLFCLLWVPLMYLFRRSLVAENGSGGVWPLLLGSVTAIFQFFYGNFFRPGGFGLSRWISGFVDIISLPVLIPLIVYFLFRLFRVFSAGTNLAHFILLWFIPSAALRALNRSSLNDPILLVLVPLLWTALAISIPFFISLCVRHPRWFVIIPSILCIAVLPLAANTVWWAFFSQLPALGFPLLFAVLIPMEIAIVSDWHRLNEQLAMRNEQRKKGH